MGETSLGRALRWWWLVILVTVVTVGSAWYGQQMAVPLYEASVEMQLTTFSPENIATFREVLDRKQIKEQIAAELGLQGQRANYDSDSTPVGISRVLATFKVRTPSLAEEIANAHIALSIDQYADLYVKPARAQRVQLERQTSAAEEDLQEAEDALATFREENDARALESRLARFEKQIADLKTYRTELQAQAATGVPDAVAEMEALLAEREKENERLISLTPEYYRLVEESEAASTEYQNLVYTASRKPGTIPEAQIRASEERMNAAFAAVSDFRLQNDIGDLAKDRSAQQDLLRQAKLQLDKLLLDRAGDPEDPFAYLDQRIVELDREAERLLALMPTHNVLQQRLSDERMQLTQVRNRLNTAKLAEEEAVTAHTVAVVKPAEAQSQPARNTWLYYGIAAAAGLALGLLLALSLEYLFGGRRQTKSQQRAQGRGPATSAEAELADGPSRTHDSRARSL